MKADLGGTIRAVAEFLGRAVSTGELEKMAARCAFQTMKDRESIEVRESTRVVLGDILKKGVVWCLLLTLVSCCPRSLRDLPP